MVRPGDVSPDGRVVAYTTATPQRGPDILVLPLAGEAKASSLIQTARSEGLPQFSPDGRWLAYTAFEGATGETYVEPNPPRGGRYQFSVSGGSRPRWCPDGKEIFYLSPDGTPWRSTSTPLPAGLRIGQPKALFRAPVDMTGFVFGTNHYVVAAERQAIPVREPSEELSATAGVRRPELGGGAPAVVVGRHTSFGRARVLCGAADKRRPGLDWIRSVPHPLDGLTDGLGSAGDGVGRGAAAQGEPQAGLHAFAGRPMASSTCEGSAAPAAQAAPVDTAMPARSRAMSRPSASASRKDTFVVLGTRGPPPFTRAPGIGQEALLQAVAQTGQARGARGQLAPGELGRAPKPTTPATFSVPARRLRSCEPPRRSACMGVPRRT